MCHYFLHKKVLVPFLIWYIKMTLIKNSISFANISFSKFTNSESPACQTICLKPNDFIYYNKWHDEKQQ